MNKKEYLDSIRKPNGEFKRQRGISPLRYAGGKTRAIGLITQYLPDELPKQILSPFIGGASLEIAWANNLDVDEVVGCDVFWPLVNFWQHILDDPDRLADKLEEFKPDGDSYKANKQILKAWWEDPKQNPLTDLEAAAHYYYNMQLSYGPMFLGWQSATKKTTDQDWARIRERVRNFRCPKLKVEHKSFQESLREREDWFVYADPPYLLGYDSQVFKAIYPNQQGSNHKNFPHEEFRDLMCSRDSQFVISYNNCGTIRSWYDQFEQLYPEWQYSYQQGETRSKNDQGESVRGSRDSRKMGREILIVNSSYSIDTSDPIAAHPDLFEEG
jgi:DNA adenine methylase